ncbi:hypothetical protein HK103_006504 [Boothiomyces macroporosus]|uniref:Reelin domain-containing protein n=1 Tax=Boothiomyces macroporosus TaxID=261099 RepID=A0AAD5Y7Y5_9FUNG|nr:hypothetical protein HK103_006504 [Boothiomyces macroporosus]
MKFSTIAVLLASAFALPNGSPICSIDETKISRMGAQENLGYSIVTKATNQNTFTFTIANPKITNFKGVLMYVVSASNPSVHLGKFTISEAKFKECTAGVAAGSTITHANPNPVPLSTTFTWTANTADLAHNDLVVRAVVATYAHGQASGPANWKHVADAPIKKANSPQGPGPVKPLSSRESATISVTKHTSTIHHLTTTVATTEQPTTDVQTVAPTATTTTQKASSGYALTASPLLALAAAIFL